MSLGGNERHGTAAKAATPTRRSLWQSIVKHKAKGKSRMGQELDEGVASWYGPRFHGRRTASGEVFNRYDLTAAHKTLPLGTRVVVSNPRTGKQVVVRINDRGPYWGNRMLDLSDAAASALGLKTRGRDWVVVNAVSPPASNMDAFDGTDYASVEQESTREVARLTADDAPMTLIDAGHMPTVGRPPKPPEILLARASVMLPSVPPAQVSVPESVARAGALGASLTTTTTSDPVAVETAEILLVREIPEFPAASPSEAKPIKPAAEDSVP